MVKHISVTLVSLAGLLLGMSSANALPLPRIAVKSQPQATMIELRQQPTPLGYVLFCMNNAGQCSGGGSRRVSLDETTWQSMERVNREVNARIAPDVAKGTTDWSLTTTFGNCNDYAVQKKARLIAQGFPARALSLSVVVTARGEGHLILTVRTDKGDFVLDNLRDGIVAWSSTGYRWVSVQSSADQNRWVRVRASNEAPRIVKVANRPAPKKIATPVGRSFSGAPAFILK